MAAFPRELGGVMRQLTRVRAVGPSAWQGETVGSPHINVLLVAGGMGKSPIQEAVAVALLGAKPEALVSIGYAGACSAAIRRGILVLANQVDTRAHTEETAAFGPIRADPSLLMLAREALSAGTTAWKEGALVTVPHIAGPQEKRLAGETGTLSIDMESYWVGWAAQAAGIPFLAVRGITDTMKDTVPDLGRFDNGHGDMRRGALLRHLASHPRLALPMALLGVGAAQADRALGLFAAALLTLQGRRAGLQP